MPRLLFAISAHGLGHLGQAAPVCNALIGLRPDIKLTVWSALPLKTLQQRIRVPFAHIDSACDIGFIMHDALNVDIAASWRRYQDREQHWASHLEQACAIVQKINPDLIVSDVGEMPLAAGQSLGIPTVAMSSLNWADMARFYFSEIPGSAPTLERLTSIYDNATLALRLSPGMPMRGQRECLMPAVGVVSTSPRDVMARHLAAEMPHPEQPRILIGMGGITTDLALRDWPQQSAFNLLVANQTALPATGDPQRAIVNADTLRARCGWNFCDLLTGCDAVICKPGYGTFVEAALAGTPVLYVRRNDWPEQSVLIDWLQQHSVCAELAMDDLMQGNFQDSLAALMAQSKKPTKPPIPRDGALIAAREILSVLDASDFETHRFE